MDSNLDQWEIIGENKDKQPAPFGSADFTYHASPNASGAPSVPNQIPYNPVPSPVPVPMPTAPTTEAFYPPINPTLTPEIVAAGQSAFFQSVSPIDPNAHVVPNYVPPQHEISFAPFVITETQAKETFRKWRDERWFAPSDFQDLKEGQLFAFLVPYYEFSATTQGVFSGKFGFYNESRTTTHSHVHSNYHDNHLRTQHTTTKTISWNSGRGQFTSTFPSILVCASVVSEDERLLGEIGVWDTSKVLRSPSYQNQLGPSKDWSTCYQKAYKKISSENLSRARSQLQKENGADIVENVTVNTTILHLQYRLLYFPVYYYGYSYEGKEYKFFINGQTGARTGERPYGLGALGRGIDLAKGFITNLFAPNPTANKDTVEEWKKLQNSSNQIEEKKG